MADVGRLAVLEAHCWYCRGRGEVWRDCGDSTCGCDGTDRPCHVCGGTGEGQKYEATEAPAVSIVKVRELVNQEFSRWCASDEHYNLEDALVDAIDALEAG